MLPTYLHVNLPQLTSRGNNSRAMEPVTVLIAMGRLRQKAPLLSLLFLPRNRRRRGVTCQKSGGEQARLKT